MTKEKSKFNLNQDTKTKIQNYWTKRANSFAELRKKELDSEKLKLWQQEILPQLPRNKEIRILDVGCGTGFFSILLAQKGYNLTGIDLTPAMITEAKALSGSINCPCDFFVEDAENLSFPDESFDVIIARNLMWNLTNPAKAYQEWLRVLIPNGILLNYDAEYAKNNAETPFINYAHANIPQKLLDECQTIYQLLDISNCNRPIWDQTILDSLDNCSYEVDLNVSDRIYSKKDLFYTPAPMFCVKVKKNKPRQ